MAEVIEGALEAGGAVVVGGEEARHAVRVKRLEPGEVVELIDGRGSVAAASYDSAEKLGKKGGWTVRLIVDSVERVEPARPAVEVLAAVPKGGRLEEMVDQLAQVGAASWSPLVTKRSGPPPRDGKRERLERIAAESAKQCGRAWDMGIGDPVELARATEPSVRTLVCDASGGELAQRETDRARVLVGPEGGWEPGELDRLSAAGAEVIRLGRHVMRVETAAVVGCAAVIGLG